MVTEGSETSFISIVFHVRIGSGYEYAITKVLQNQKTLELDGSDNY
jgi:hypothetical protein